MRQSPRHRRLEADYAAIKKLDRESSIFSFEATGKTPESYRLIFSGLGFWKLDTGQVVVRDEHQVTVELGAAYPRLIPGIAWQTPVFHPNISTGGVVCLGGYGTHWVPSLKLDEMCVMLWDMIRYKNFDTESPYNREAANWTKTQTQHSFPIDTRSLRNEISNEINYVQGDVVVRNVIPPPIINSNIPPVQARPSVFESRAESRVEIHHVPVDPPTSELDEAGILFVD